EDGAAAYARARARAEELLRAGTSPADPAFDPVLRELESVPFESRFHADAEALRERLMRVRTLAPRPLAERKGDDQDAALVKKEAECVALAEALGRADGGHRAALAQRLDACRAAMDRYREQRHDAQAP
ncbi:MAG TPA: hypothetical protein VND93_34055, partial [Myxococcales bacterium]|nr:hypothetical protein [Myxococcales bacterium]